MTGLKTFIVTVKEYDFEIDGVPQTPPVRHLKYLFSPFVVEAYDEEDAINKVSSRTGWLIKDAVVE